MRPSSPSDRQTHAAPQAQGASSTQGTKHPIPYQPMCPEHCRAAVSHLSMALNQLTQWPGGGCPLLIVLQPVCLLQLPGGEAPAVIPGSPCAFHPPQRCFQRTPQSGWTVGKGRLEGHSRCLHQHCRNSHVPALTGIPWDHSRTSPGGPAVQGRANEHHMVCVRCVNPTSIPGCPWAGAKPCLPAATEAAFQDDFSPE